MALDLGGKLLPAAKTAGEPAAELAPPPDGVSAASPAGEDRQLLALLKASEEQFRAVVASIPGPVYRCACEDWQIRFMSDYIEQICGFPAADFIRSMVRIYGSIIHPDDRQYVIDEIDAVLLEGSPYSLQYRVLQCTGGERWVPERGQAILGDNGEQLWLDGVILDVTDQVLAEQDRDRAESELRRQAELNRHQALHDALTGLPNRVLFQDRVRQAILAAQRGGGRLAVMVMDLDRFKEINDTLGHTCGDRFLIEAAKRLQTTLRSVDSIARLGGDEFAMLLQGADAGAVEAATARIRSAFEAPVTLEGLPLLIESAIVADMFRMKTVLERLGDMGVRLSVDDFGTGYTSLGYLRRLPINELKIDRSFVANMTSSEEDAVIVRSTIDLGRNLGLDVVAEGVEDTAVLRRLEQLGCDVAQGFLMSRPVPANELSTWLKQLASPERPSWAQPVR